VAGTNPPSAWMGRSRRRDSTSCDTDCGVSVQQPPATPVAQPYRQLRWFLLAGALVVGVGVGAAIALLRSSGTTPAVMGSAPSPPGISWASGKKLAPAFALRNENGAPVSLRQFRGRPVIVTFIDPVCRNLCPLEAKVLDRVVASFPAAQRPAIVAVSVNRWGNARKNLLLDRSKWSLPSDWHWAVGTPAALAQVWKDYEIGVTTATKTIAGITVHRITHTEAAYIVDPRGYQRALFVYPFLARDVESTLRSLAGA
jgi:cytochrome oxidase Cu insertion factor (SCO1/SenC/PrrC family)